jgi:hypothetical protein
MNYTCFFLPLIAVLASCGNNLIANPCATPDSEYRVIYTETSGTCGKIDESILTISSVGTVEDTSSFHCEKYESNGCAQDSFGCQHSMGSEVFRMDTHLVFDRGGETASGFGSLAIFDEGKVICNSEYLIQYYRKNK